jgi:hypothetical protein
MTATRKDFEALAEVIRYAPRLADTSTFAGGPVTRAAAENLIDVTDLVKALCRALPALNRRFDADLFTRAVKGI